jgi:hypothetical protein|eukprot:COSAG01_NODE_16114_length_1268_cov_66.205304_3_plen_70_part_00
MHRCRYFESYRSKVYLDDYCRLHDTHSEQQQQLKGFRRLLLGTIGAMEELVNQVRDRPAIDRINIYSGV